MNKFKEPLYITMIVFLTTVVISAIEHTFYIEFQGVGLAALDYFIAVVIFVEMIVQLVLGCLYYWEEVKKERENLKIKKE